MARDSSSSMILCCSRAKPSHWQKTWTAVSSSSRQNLHRSSLARRILCICLFSLQ
ncbi:hypothetical protein O3M35_004420 [Rhynocoris fuscipes]|uniref:Uncharacterized protein n=1 Tax=Rhynocoris fuscipes TaxID=488301 RepID=A0AAW1CNB4_9HEMI